MHGNLMFGAILFSKAEFQCPHFPAACHLNQGRIRPGAASRALTTPHPRTITRLDQKDSDSQQDRASRLSC